jgi:small-conductance mechanosensitive channel
VAFFAIWSVLSNLFCAVLSFTVGPFRLGDLVEVIDSADKPGVKGRVIAINLLYTTLEDQVEEGQPAALLQVPNSLFFQKAIRRWRGPNLPAGQ